MLFGKRKANKPQTMPQALPKKMAKTYRTPAGEVYTPFLTMAEQPHLLIAGATGSGKSVTVNGIITSLLMVHSPYQAQFILIDPKRVELSQFANMPHTIKYAAMLPDIIQALTMATIETERRFSVMQSRGEREFSGSHLYIVIDELADLMLTAKKTVAPLLQKLVMLGRAARIHVIACTQTVLSQVITTEFKCNIPTVLGLRTATKQQSRYLVDCYGCEALPDPKKTGICKGYIREGADIYPVTIYRYSESVINRVLSWWTSKQCVA